MQLRNWRASGENFKFSPAPRDHTLIVELQVDTSTGDFKTGGCLIIPDDKIHHPQRDRIERASYRHSEFAETKPAAVLHRRLEAGRENDHGKNLSNSSRVMMRKRTRSPGRSSDGGFASVSNNRTGVRPIRFQPPGESNG